MKKVFATVLAILMICMASAVTAFAEDGERTVTVKGSATVLTDADSAGIRLGVLSAAKEAAEASRINAEQIDRLISALTETGIEKKDITTSYYYVNARRNYNEPDENGEYAIIGYEVGNTLNVTVRDIEKVGSIIDIALANGANSCDGISFSSSKAGEAQDEALKNAVKEARRRAELIAEASGEKVGKVLTVTENISDGGFMVSNTRDFGAAEMAKGVSTQIRSEGLSFTASVMVTYLLEATE